MGNFLSNRKKQNQIIEPIQIKSNESKKIMPIELNKPVEFDYKKYKIGNNLEIKFKNSFNDPIDEKIISKFRFYEKIIFGFSFNQHMKNKIPSSILFIQFGHNYNKSIDNLVIEEEQDNIKELVLGEKFNQEVNNLSPGIKKISFGYDFNKPVNNLPNGIEYIKFGNNFNNNVDYLPCSLISIIFGNSFNNDINNLPSSIKYIELGKDFSKKINNIPFSLEKIKFEKNYYDNNKEYLDIILFSNEFIEICF